MKIRLFEKTFLKLFKIKDDYYPSFWGLCVYVCVFFLKGENNFVDVPFSGHFQYFLSLPHKQCRKYLFSEKRIKEYSVKY